MSALLDEGRARPHLPNFLIIGAARSGSTWIAKNLGLHPEIYIPVQKELHFFDRDYDRGLAHYEAFFDGRAAAAARAVGEATPAYLHHERAAARIRRHLPEARLVVCLRDPAERLYSRYWNARGRFAHNRGLSFEQKLEQKPELIREGFYAEHLSRFLAHWPRDQLLVLLYDDLRNAPHEFLKTIYSFLDVDTSFVSAIAEHKVNAAAAQKRTVKSRSVYWLGKALGRTGLHGVASRLERRNAGRIPPLPARTRRWLIETYYGERNEALAELLGRDLSHWNSA